MPSGTEGEERARCLSVGVTTRSVGGWLGGSFEDSDQRRGTVAGDCTWRVQQPRERTTGRTRRGARNRSELREARGNGYNGGKVSEELLGDMTLGKMEEDASRGGLTYARQTRFKLSGGLPFSANGGCEPCPEEWHWLSAEGEARGVRYWGTETGAEGIGRGRVPWLGEDAERRIELG